LYGLVCYFIGAGTGFETPLHLSTVSYKLVREGFARRVLGFSVVVAFGHRLTSDPPLSIVQNFINDDSEGTTNSAGTCMLPEDAKDDAETCKSK
jgi:hypothetical protein